MLSSEITNYLKNKNSKLSDKLENVWQKAQHLYSHTTWPGWVDHGTTHIQNVLNNLDKLLPIDVLERWDEKNIFILIAGAMLHDVGMTKIEGEDLDEIRQEHGSRGGRIIKNHFYEIIGEELCNSVCHVAENHNTSFGPKASVDQALFVRFADGLDFGPERAPHWVFDILKPFEEQKKYWNEHIMLDSPIIDNKLMRIVITGTVKDERFIKSLRDDFENPLHSRLQNGIFNPDKICESTMSYVIIDKTIKEEETVSPRAVARPISFNKESYFIASRCLYNLGHYDAARKCFEDTLKKHGGSWTDERCNAYFYHYLQTLNKLGFYEDVLKIIEPYDLDKFDAENRLAIRIAQGIAYLRTGKHSDASTSFDLAKSDIALNGDQQIVNKADISTWQCIITLEELRRKFDQAGGLTNQQLASLKRQLSNAHNFYRQLNINYETHYLGRFYGLQAFVSLLEMDAKKSPSTKDAWDDILKKAKTAYGGNQHENRVSFGVLAGKYCEAVVFLRKYCFCKDGVFSNNDRKQTLISCAKSLTEVLEAYSKMYHIHAVKWLWNKISALCFRVLTHMQKERLSSNNAFKLLQKLEKSLPEVKDYKVQIFTPLN